MPTGYKVVRVHFDDGKPPGTYENFMTGFWVSGESPAEVWGRPAALAFVPDGALLSPTISATPSGASRRRWSERVGLREWPVQSGTRATSKTPLSDPPSRAPGFSPSILSARFRSKGQCPILLHRSTRRRCRKGRAGRPRENADPGALQQRRGERSAMTALDDTDGDRRPIASSEAIAILRRAHDMLAARHEENERLRLELESFMAQQRLLLEERVWLRAMIDHVPDYLFVKDTESRFVIANTAVATDLGLGDPAAIIGKTDLDLEWKERAADFVDHERIILDTGQPMTDRDDFVELPSGKKRWLSQTKLALRNADGAIIGLVGIARDITGRKEAEVALEASEALFRGLLDASPDAMLVIDAEGIILLASRRAAPIYGHPVERLIGMPLKRLVPERQAALYAARLAAAATSPTSTGPDEELFGVRADGTEFPVEISLSPQLTERGQVVIASIRDVTERRRSRTQLRQAQKMEAIGNLTGGLAHDFNNLLGVVIGNLDLLRERLAGDPEADELAGTRWPPRSAAPTSPAGCSPSPAASRCSPGGSSSTSWSAASSSCSSRTLASTSRSRLQPGTDVWPVLADPAQLEACLVNLDDQCARRHARRRPAADRHRQPHLDEDYASLHPDLQPGDYSLIEVSDNGTGMSPETLAHDFRAVLHHQGAGQGHRPRSHHGLRLHEAVGRPHQRLQRARRRHDVPALPAARRRAARTRRSRGVRELACRRPAVPSLPSRTIPGSAISSSASCPAGLPVPRGRRRPLRAAVLETEPVDLLFTDIIMPGGMSGYDLAQPAGALAGAESPPHLGLPRGKAEPWRPRLAGMQLLNKPYRKDDLARALHGIFGDEGTGGGGNRP